MDGQTNCQTDINMMGWRNRVIVGQTDKGTLTEEHMDGQMDGSKTTIQT